jgi:glycosyltransferase involved in cell wall biosynthesis
MQVRILGGAQQAKGVLGRLPRNWVVQPFDTASSGSVQNFLSGLDFFVHYPHENWIEAFARTPIEAMAVGIPTILPPHMQELYGDGAIYAEPKNVFAVIQSLWRDRRAYEEQIARGFAFIESTCALKRFADRVAPYIGTTRIAPAETELAL